MLKPLTIGDHTFQMPVFLAPMAGCTDSAFRRIARGFGVELLYTEMISSHAMAFGSTRSLDIARYTPEEKPLAIQIFGSNPAFMRDAARKVVELGADIVDVNLGCSVPKIAKSGGGAVLCKSQGALKEVLTAVVEGAAPRPVTVKCRKGWDETTPSAFTVAKIAQEAGVALLTVHGRTSVQAYTGNADWAFLRNLKREMSIPLMGNGDVRTPEDLVRMCEMTGVDGVLIGRGALGTPWVFREIRHYLATGERLEPPSLEEMQGTILRHLKMQVGLDGEARGVPLFRTHLVHYIKGLAGSARFREQVVTLKSYDQVASAVRAYFGALAAGRTDPLRIEAADAA